MSFLAWAVFAAWSFAALACGFGVFLSVTYVIAGMVSAGRPVYPPRAPSGGGDDTVVAMLLSALGFAFSLERVAALWPW